MTINKPHTFVRDIRNLTAVLLAVIAVILVPIAALADSPDFHGFTVNYGVVAVGTDAARAYITSSGTTIQNPKPLTIAGSIWNYRALFYIDSANGTYIWEYTFPANLEQDYGSYFYLSNTASATFSSEEYTGHYSANMGFLDASWTISY